MLVDWECYFQSIQAGSCSPFPNEADNFAGRHDQLLCRALTYNPSRYVPLVLQEAKNSLAVHKIIPQTSRSIPRLTGKYIERIGCVEITLDVDGL